MLLKHHFQGKLTAVQYVKQVIDPLFFHLYKEIQELYSNRTMLILMPRDTMNHLRVKVID